MRRYPKIQLVLLKICQYGWIVEVVCWFPFFRVQGVSDPFYQKFEVALLIYLVIHHGHYLILLFLQSDRRCLPVK